MANWILFVLISELMWSFTSFFDKILLSKNHIKSPFVFIVFNGLMNILLIFLLPFFNFGPLNAADLLIVFLTGLFLSLGIVFYYKAVQHEEISRVLMMWQITPIFILIISFFFLDESLTANHFIGFLFLLVAGVIASYKKVEGSFRLSKAFYLMLCSTFFISIFYVLSKYVYTITSFWSAFMWLRGAGFVGLFALLVPSIRRQFAETLSNMNPKAKGLIGFKMLIDFSAFVFLGYALLNGPVSLVSALGNTTIPIFIFLITLVTSLYFPKIIKEEIDKKIILTKILAIAFIITGIAFINSWV